MTTWSGTDARLLVVCSSGTYVRAIARDLGRAVDSAAHLLSLRRLAVGALDAQDAVGIEALRAAGHDEAVGRIRAVSDELLDLPARYIDEPADNILATGGTA
jgi:tRNA pseudouridine55 synthase